MVRGTKEECGGIILTPVTTVVEHHCSKHPRVFKKWWTENANKTKAEIVSVPKCLNPHEHLKTLEEMINLANDILNKNS